MKTKHIQYMIASTSAAVVAGSIFYWLARRRNRAAIDAMAAKSAKPRKERIRQVMHQAKENQSPIARQA